jgi:serine/threonine protein kinase
VGTHYYSAPEVGLHEEAIYGPEYTIIADIWSTGLVFYYMLFGQEYFTKKEFGVYGNVSKLRPAQMEKTGKNLIFDDAINDLDPDVKDLLKGMIEPDPRKRLDWKEVFNHPVFARMSLSNSLMTALGRSYSKVDPNKDFENEKNDVNKIPPPKLNYPKPSADMDYPSLGYDDSPPRSFSRVADNFEFNDPFDTPKPPVEVEVQNLLKRKERA